MSHPYRPILIFIVILLSFCVLGETGARRLKAPVELDELKQLWVGIDDLGRIHGMRFEGNRGEFVMIENGEKIPAGIVDVSLDVFDIIITLDEPYVYDRSKSRRIRGRGFDKKIWLNVPGTGEIVFRPLAELEEDFQVARTIVR